MFDGLVQKDSGLARQTTFSTTALTTPVAYLPSLLPDCFANAKGATFCYYSIQAGDERGRGWILWSCGVDEVYDLTKDNISKAYNPLEACPSDYLIDRTYDPTNGTFSSGDIWKMKQ